MDRASLELFLSQGLSLEQIGKRVGRHPLSVGYWVREHGLQIDSRDRHAGVDRDQLTEMVNAGLPVAQLAEKLDRSTTTVRHWLRTYGLQTRGGGVRRRLAREGKEAGLAVIKLTCKHHGETDFYLEGRGYYRCKKCRAGAVVRRRRKVKATLVAEAGGGCMICGYDRCVSALEFHHIDPSEKAFGVAYAGMARSIDRLRQEARKCVLLCSNCHAEVEGGIVSLPTKR